MKNDFPVLPYPSGYKAALTISFDYETDIISAPDTFIKKIKKQILNLSNNAGITKKIISAKNKRAGAETAYQLLAKYGFHATWFGIGHTLLTNNINKIQYRINQILRYAPKETPYRTSYPTFYNEPYSDCDKYPFLYFGDITKKYYENGEDIQCHSFSHPFMSFETIENIKIDIEDWQNAAERLGYEKAKIFAFPFLSDGYYYYPDFNLKDCNLCNNYGKVEIMPIDGDKLEILHSYGIRMVTRSGYYLNEKPFVGMKKYLNSDLYYVHSRSMDLSKLTEYSLKIILDEIIKNRWMVDFWCHNWNVAENPDKFELFLKTLNNYRNVIWIPTLKEFWEYQENYLC